MSRRFSSHNDAVDHLHTVLESPDWTALDMEILAAGLLADDGLDLGDLVAAIEQRETRRAATLLKALALVATGEVRDAARAGADRLKAAGVTVEDAFATLGNARPRQAWAVAYEDEADGVIVDFDYPGSRPHAFAVWFDFDRPGLVRQINVFGPVGDRRDRWPDVEEIPFAVARLLLEEPLGRPNPLGGRYGLESYGPIVRSRLPLLDELEPAAVLA